MSESKMPRFSAEEQQQNEREARLQYGPDTVNKSVAKWNSYTDAEREAILAEQDAIYEGMAAALAAGTPATDPDVREYVERWHQHIHNFYEPTLDMMRGLADMYVMDARFRATFEAFHADLPEYLQEAIVDYVDELETAELERMMAEDEARARRLGL
ncbi:MAG: TipAS antibiotic-recognition domain-containing protein [Chloroflexota bacterium]